MKRINTIAELKQERIRLMQLQLNLEVEIESDFKELKHSFSPSRLVPAGISRLVTSNNHGILNESVSMLVDLLIRRGLLRNAGFISRLVVPMLARNAAGNLISDNKTKIINWLGDLISKKKNKRKEPDELFDQSTVDFYN